MKFKIFGGTIENSTMNDERGPHEWSHDVFMITCIYPNAMGWPLVTCDVVVTGDLATSTHNSRRVLNPVTRHAWVVFGARVCGPSKHASFVAMLVGMHIGSQA